MEDNSQTATAAAESAETTTGSMSAGPQARPSSEEAEEAKTPTEGADTELEGLALSSDITELAYALEAVSTLIFEIQVRACPACCARWHGSMETRCTAWRTAC